MRAAGLFVIVVLASVSYGGGISRIQNVPLPSPNPTSYAFPLTVGEVHAKAWEAFSIDHQLDKPIFDKSPGVGFQSILSAECATNAVFGENIFRDPASAQDIYLHTFHSPFEMSPVYSGSKGGLPYIAAFHLHLAASDSNTTITVSTLDSQVINGTKFGFGPCGPGQGNNYVSVKPTTIEEYTILRYIGDYVGITNMPPVILPKR